MNVPKWKVIGKNFVITGGASGLGVHYVKVFLELGAKAIAILDIAEEAGQAAAERLNEIYQDKVVFIKCDISKEEDVVIAFEVIVSQFKQIDVIINNAGIMNDAPDIWRTACAVNWEGVVSFTLKGIQHMRKDEGGAGGTIINVSSTAALVQFPFLPIYSGSKMAVLHFSQCIAMTPFYENTNIRILTMCFGATDTPLLQNLEPRCYDISLGKVLEQTMRTSAVLFQKVESAVTAVVDMFENGGPGTIWSSINNRPAKDITPDINRVFQELEALTI